MTEDRFNELMRDAAQTYRTPPEAPLDDMWGAIEGHVPAVDHRAVDHRAADHGERARRGRYTQRLAIAATLVIGVGLGRYSASFGRGQTSGAAPLPVSSVAALPPDSSTMANSYELETNRYLGQTAALLIALPSEVRAGRANDAFVGRASELLTTTRLLIDSPASNDPSMRDLLEDLELVLAQVVRLQNNNNGTELDLISRALEQRDVLPRLRSAVGGYSAN